VSTTTPTAPDAGRPGPTAARGRRWAPSAAAAAAAALLLAACTGGEGATSSAATGAASNATTGTTPAASSPAPSSPTPSIPATGDGATTPASGSSDATVTGAPAALGALVGRLYAGQGLGAGATATVAAALEGATPAALPAGAKATTGTWFGTPVAVVTAGRDVTLAVGPTWRVVGGWWPSLGVDAPSLGRPGPRFVLAVGSDARRGEPLDRTRADVLQVVGTDGSGGGGVLGLARDLWVPLSTGGKGKINAAMVFGGPEAQLKTVRAATGLPAEGYVLVGFGGFTRVVDDQGGIPMVVPERVDASHADLVIEKGPQTLTGKQALAYARERKTLPDGDFGRSRHQGQIILAAAVKAKLAGPQAIPAAFTSFSGVGRSDLSAEAMLTYAARLYALNPLEVGRGVAKGAFGTASGQSIVVLGEQARRLFADFRDGRLS
jgi:LCP family protein required for cell wall assembly